MKIQEIVKQSLNEGILDYLKNASQKIFNWVAGIVNKIGFGQKAEINLAQVMGLNKLKEEAPMNAEREKFDLTSMIGYYNEYSVAWKLAYALEFNGVNIRPNVDEGLKKYADNYKRYITDNAEKFGQTPEKIAQELQRAEDGSEVMAKKMWDEIIAAHDLKLIDVDISLTGKEAAGFGKEDILVKIRKRGTDQVQDMIKASLKLYKTPSGVNVYNSTFASYLVTVLTGKDDPGTGQRAIKSFLEEYPQYADDIATATKITNQWKDIKKTGGRVEANKFVTDNKGYQKMRDLLFGKMFNDFYSRDKAAINQRILGRLGLDGADDVYLLVGTERQKMVAVSSRTSKEFGTLYAQLKAGFNIRYDIPSNPEIVTCYLVIDSEEGQELARFTIAFKEGATFPHMWNVSQIVKAAKSEQGIK